MVARFLIFLFLFALFLSLIGKWVYLIYLYILGKESKLYMSILKKIEKEKKSKMSKYTDEQLDNNIVSIENIMIYINGSNADCEINTDNINEAIKELQEVKKKMEKEQVS